MITDFYVWWTNQPQAESITDRQLKSVPAYLRKEFYSRMGRAGRARLWIAKSLKADDFQIFPWPTTELAEEFAGRRGPEKDAAGIVFRKEHLSKVQKLPGTITDHELNIVTG